MCLQFFLAWRQLFWSTTAEKIAEAFAGVVPVVETLEQAFRECSKGKPFFGGDAVGLVDITLGSHPIWMRAVDQTAGTNPIWMRAVHGRGRREQGGAGRREAFGAVQGVSG